MSTTVRSTSPFLSTLPGHYYYDPALYELEQERIFSSMWVCVGRADDLPEASTYRRVTLGQESVLLVRDREGTLRAFLNVCRHRGARLCSEEAGSLKGSIQCRYHAWTYGLDGCLIGAPNVLHNEHFNREDFGLVTVACEIWEGLLWLNLADSPPPLAPQLEGVLRERFADAATFARYTLGELRVGKSIIYDVRANWKLVLENFMECYHCGPMHPELCDLLPGYRSGRIYDDGEAATLAEHAEAFTITGKASRPPLPGLLPQDLRRYYGFILLPNVLVSLLDDHVVLHTLYPEAPDYTRITCDWLFHPQSIASADFDPMDAVAIFDLVNHQDWEVCELAQQGMRSKAYRAGGVYVPHEHDLRTLCDFILAKLA